MAADIVFFLFFLYGLVFGMRRGFYKELIAVVALVLGVAAARFLKDPVADALHDKAGFGLHTGQILGSLVAWLVVVLVVNIAGRLVLRRLRDPDAENKIEGAADAAVESVDGKPKQGPVTYLTNPLASTQRSIIYWSDKLLGAVLGIAKGVVAAYVLFALIYCADMAVGANWGFTESIKGSHAKQIYSQYLEASFRSLPEYRLVENIAILESLEVDPSINADAIERMAADPRWADVKATPAFQRIAADPDVQKAWEQRSNGKRAVNSVIHLSQVRGLLADSDFRSAFSNVDILSIRNSALSPSK
ncbi:CvpA family protein [bacterium]|nr:CvpA family protein [bacterium]